MKFGLLGFGTVGSGVYEISKGLQALECKKVLVRRPREAFMTDRIEDIVTDPEIELVAEAMGGLHPAYEYAVAAIQNRKHFITANKLLVSVYGAELTSLAKENGVGFLFGAACGGGIAYLSNLQIARSIDRIDALGGILNGTTNYILDSMQRRSMDYAQALSEAQSLGYAEHDPSSDVDGLDTQRKLILACAVGFDAYLRCEDIPTFGISAVLPMDIIWAKENDLALRLCARAELDANGSICTSVEPTLISSSAPEAAVLTNVNYAWYHGANCGLMSYIGQGAGKLPTASNMLRDMRAIAAGRRFMTDETCRAVTPDNSTVTRSYYLRLKNGISVPEEWIQRKTNAGEWTIYETLPIPVQDMHTFMKTQENAFMAGIQKG